MTWPCGKPASEPGSRARRGGEARDAGPRSARTRRVSVSRKGSALGGTSSGSGDSLDGRVGDREGARLRRPQLPAPPGPGPRAPGLREGHQVQLAVRGHRRGTPRRQQEQRRGHPCEAAGVGAEQQRLQLGGAQRRTCEGRRVRGAASAPGVWGSRTAVPTMLRSIPVPVWARPTVSAAPQGQVEPRPAPGRLGASHNQGQVPGVPAQAEALRKWGLSQAVGTRGASPALPAVLSIPSKFQPAHLQPFC